MSALTPFVHAWLLICMGMAFEVILVAFADLDEAPDWRLKGHTYVWMIPIYALIYPGLLLLWPVVSAWPWALRGAFYTVLIFIVEYLSGWLLRKTIGRCPWDYAGRRWAVHGLIRLDFAPLWFGASLLYELAWRVLRGV